MPAAEPTAAPPPTAEVLGLPIHRVTFAQALAHALTLAERRRRALLMTPNTDHLLRWQRDPEFRAVYRQASFVVADGIGVVLASRILGDPLPARVAGSDLMPELCVAAARAGLGYFFIGGNPGDAERAAAVLARRAGRDGCVGIDCPPLGFERDPSYVDALARRVAERRPHIVCIGLGSPKQERLMVEIAPRAGDFGVMLGVGVTFSFVAGTVKREPRLVRRAGGEWLWRLLCEPRRLWRRYLDDLIHFPWLVLRARLRRRR